MIKDNNLLLKLTFTEKKAIFIELYNIVSDSVYDLFDLILDDPIEIFWFECFNIFIGYFHLLSFSLDSTVRIK